MSLPHLFLHILPPAWLLAAATHFLAPSTAASTVGFPIPSPTANPAPPSPYIYMTGIRCLFLALLTTTLLCYDDWRALTILDGCLALTGLSEWVLCGVVGRGWWYGGKVYGVMSFGGLWSTWRLYLEYF